MSPDRYGDRSLFEPGEEADSDRDETPAGVGPSRIDELRRVLREAGAPAPSEPALDVGGAGT